MAKLSIECKKMMVDEVAGRLNKADILIVTNYKGLSAQDLNDLRTELRNISGKYLVLKDSMARKALATGDNKIITDLIEGDIGIVVDEKGDDPTHSPKILVRFAKDHESLKIRGGIMKGSLISREEIMALAALPSREVLLGKLANVLNAPISGLAVALNGIISKLLYVLNALKDKKQEGGK